MAISDKLIYLNTTKGKIKDSINNLGGSIDSNTTFRDYATQLDSIYNRLPKVSGTGSDITLTPTLKGRLGSVLKGDTLQDGTPTPDSPVAIQSVEGIQTITIGDGTNSDSYTIDLGSIKLYNGDYITGTPDNWSIYRENGSIVLNGSEDWIQNTVYNNVYYVENFLTDVTTIEPREMLSDYFGYGGLLTQGSGAIEIGKFYQWIGLPQRLILGYNSTSLNDFKAWLSTHKTEIIYPLATPTTTPITDTYLISQLNALYNAKSYNGQTNITVDGNLPMILEVSALKGE